MIIYGKNSVYETLKSNVKIKRLYIKNDFKLNNEIYKIIKEKSINIEKIDQKFLFKITSTDKHQGIACEIPDYNYSSIDEIINSKNKNKNILIFILDSIEDPHNLGSVIRVAECLGVNGIIIPKNRSSKVNETVFKTSAGAVNHVKIAMVTNINYAIDELKDKFINIIATDAKGKSIYETNLNKDIALIIGSEGFGLHQLTLKKSDETVSIPMHGEINSLNASVACGIIASEINRQCLYK